MDCIQLGLFDCNVDLTCFLQPHSTRGKHGIVHADRKIKVENSIGLLIYVPSGWKEVA